MKAHDFRNLSAVELTTRLEVLKSEMYGVQEAVRLGKEKNHAKLRGMRADIARIQTVLSENAKEVA
jgi:ribosomal protein L29